MPGRKQSTSARAVRFLRRGGLEAAVAIGVAGVAAALVEAALVPGLVIGAAAVVAPRLLSKGSGRHKRPSTPRAGPGRQRGGDGISLPRPKSDALLVRPLHLKEATFKTISFRVIMTSFDFGFNYVILGELVTAAGLSTVSIVAGPFFYFVHETGWTYIRPLLPAAASGRRVQRVDYELLGLRMSHALAKTITYRLFATASEFSTNYIVVRDLATAAWLSAFGFFVGPFVYFAHERFWEGLQNDTAGRNTHRDTHAAARLPAPSRLIEPTAI